MTAHFNQMVSKCFEKIKLSLLGVPPPKKKLESAQKIESLVKKKYWVLFALHHSKPLERGFQYNP